MSSHAVRLPICITPHRRPCGVRRHIAEVLEWFVALGDTDQGLDEPHTRQLEGKLRELRSQASGTSWG
jgi:hypothetical protein